MGMLSDNAIAFECPQKTDKNRLRPTKMFRCIDTNTSPAHRERFSKVKCQNKTNVYVTF